MPVEHRQNITRMIIRHARMVGAAKPGRKKLPRQQYPRLVELAYAKRLGQLVGSTMRRAFAPLLHALPGVLARARARHRLDAADDFEDDDEIDDLDTSDDSSPDDNPEVREFLAAALLITRAINVRPAARQAATETSAFNRVQLGRQLEAGLGVNVLATDAVPTPVSNAFVDSNVAYVRSLANKVSSDVSGDVFRAIQRATTAATDEQVALQVLSVQRAIEDRIEGAERRAQVAARIEVGKLYGQVNADRQRRLGVERFVWRTMQDDKVRDEHVEREGEVYSYDDPPDGELPGDPPMCRCWAEPVLDDVDDSAGGSDDESDDE